MGTCRNCGEEIKFRYVGGRLTPIHVNGGWCQGRQSVKTKEISLATIFEDYCSKTTCPECGEDVYLVRHNGGSVWVDSLGWPWPKHPCMDTTEEPSWYVYFKKIEPKKNENETLFTGVVIEGIRQSGDELNLSKIILAIDGGVQGRVVLSTEANTTASDLKGEIVIVNIKKKIIIFSNHRVNKIFEIGLNSEILGLSSNWETLS